MIILLMDSPCRRNSFSASAYIAIFLIQHGQTNSSIKIILDKKHPKIIQKMSRQQILPHVMGANCIVIKTILFYRWLAHKSTCSPVGAVSG